jgi:uncharacterized repeat protein (TIGR01451 family)
MDSNLRAVAAGLVATAAFFLPALHAVVPPGHDHQLPDFDKRREAPAQALPPAKAASADKLRGRLQGLRVEHDALLQSPKHITSTAGFLSGPEGEGGAITAAAARALPPGDRHRAIKAFLNEHRPLFGHGAEALEKARLKRDAVTRNNGMRTAVWEQRVDDIAVYEGVLVGHITKRGELASVSSQFLAEPERAADAGTPDRAALQNAPAISAAQAVWFAAESIEEALPIADIAPLTARPEGSEKRQKFKAGALPGEAEVRLVWLPLNESSLRLCWEVELTRRAGGERYRVLVDARSGDVPLRRRLTVYLTPASFRVFTSDSPRPFSPGWPTPNTNQPPFAERALITLSALNTNASPIGWISDAENETRGNNVDAHTDRNADDLPDLPRPQGSPFRVFDPPLDLSQPPATYADAAAVQLFYWCNWMHDRLYELGFDEASGNFQKDNFGRGGLGNDAMQADAQDGSGFNNANFTPTPDGVPGRIQMFIFDSPEPDIDGDFDAEVILHEYVHGLSTRLVGGGVGIGTLQAAGMGEGWSDFYAMALLSEPGDDLDAAIAYGAYASTLLAGLTENYYFGIRRYPYSTDLTKNPLTFKDIDPTQISPHTGVPVNPIFGPFNPAFAAEVHSQGEVWCSMLWDARAALIRKHGYAVGNPLILQLVTDGMKLSPPNPSFTQARDAILLADQINNQGANYGDLWAAFARRGLGFNAVAPDSAVVSGTLEAFDLPDSLFIVQPAGFFASGPQGGPFAPACQTYSLTNISQETISWTARVTQPWLGLLPIADCPLPIVDCGLTMMPPEAGTNGQSAILNRQFLSGTLAPGAATNLVVCLNSNALLLPLGAFTDTLTISNTVSRVVQRRAAELRVLTFASMPFAEDFEGGVLQNYWSLSGTPGHVTQITSLNEPRGSNHLTLDSVGNVKARNEFTLGLDLGGYSNVVLTFWAKSFGDEPDGPPPSPFRVAADFDGVAISEDGVAWYEVRPLRGIPSYYTNFVVDLDAFVAARGLRYNSTFRIRFNQVDDFQIPFDGLALDDISITGIPTRRFAVTVPAAATEGEGRLAGRGLVMLGQPVATPVTVTLRSSDAARLAVPAAVVIPAGSDRVAFDLTVVDNALLDGTTPVVIRAEAPGYFDGRATMQVADNETATLRVKLPQKAREGGGRMPKHGVVRASARPHRDVAVQLRSSDPAELQVPASVVLPAGETRATFDLLPVDDQRLDGPRKVTITAHVENWTDGSDSMLVLDNDDPALFVTLPASASEGSGTLTNAGTARLSGTLPTNLLVRLASSDGSELRVPVSVTVPAGQLEAQFDLTVVDDPLTDGPQRATVSASAKGFLGAAESILVFDNETPPVPLQPQPPNGATNVAVSLALSWNPGIGETLVNGGFETGDLTGWTVANQGFGSWVINDGTFNPDGPEDTNAPLSGQYCALAAQTGSGQHTLSQDVLIPADALGAELSWWDKIRNHGPNFSPNQVFRVEVRDTNDAVLAVAFTTKLGDPLLNDWARRRFDLAPFRGRLVRIAFIEEDAIGYFNVLLDDVSVRLGEPELPTTYDVYFGTTPTPGAAERLGNTTNAFWPLPPLALNTTYHWQVVAQRGPAVIRGPVWRFTTRGVGAVHHFEWGRIASPQSVDQRFAATLTAKDEIGNTVRDFSGQVDVTALPGTGTGSSVVISEIEIANDDRVEFLNVSGAPVDVSGWTITLYDARSWPGPLTTVTIPSGSVLPAGRLFRLNDEGRAPGHFPNLFAGTNINWGVLMIGNPVAVLLRDVAGNVVDFACAGSADPSRITAPTRIPAEEWNGLPVFIALPQFVFTLQREGDRDRHEASDWRIASGNFAALNPGLTLPFVRPAPAAVVPTVLTNFVTGVWSGFLTVQEFAPHLTLLADDGDGHRGLANEFAVLGVNDLGVTVADSPDVVIVGEELTYRVTITNSGPHRATGVVLTNILPEGMEFVSAATFNGACSNAGQSVVCALDDLPREDSARVTLTVRTSTMGLFTNVARAARAEPEAYAPNNTALAVTTVTGPSISSTNLSIDEGNRVTNMARMPVRLSVPCKLPVSVNFATSDSTSTAGVDYQPTNGVLVFPPGVTNLFVEVPIFGDLLDEGLDVLFFSLSSATNGVVVQPLVRCRINDDDPTPSLTINDVTLTEGPRGSTNYAEFNVQLNAPSGGNVSIGFSTENRTALAPADYQTTFGTLTFASGVTNQTVRVPVLGDSRFEPTETFVVALTNAIGAIPARATGVCIIQDDDDAELDHFIWSTVPSPQFVDVPFHAMLEARDGQDRPATGFNGAVTVRALADSREITVGAGTNLWDYPLATLFHDARTQVIYLPEELGGPGKINALALQLATAPGQTLSNWTLRLKHTVKTNYAQAAWESDGWTTVYRNDEDVPDAGWVTFLFATPFDYDGTNSLLADFSFNNATYSENGFCRSTTAGQPRTVFFQTDSAFGDPLTWSGTRLPPPLMTDRVPNARFLIETPVAMIPDGTVRLAGGFWTGPVTVRQPGTNIFLRANDTAGHIAVGNVFAVEPATDADGDGLPDTWKARYFGSPRINPDADADGDGLSNAEEFRAGTNPADAASAVRILAVELRGPDVVIRFASVSGRAYRLERIGDLSRPGWTEVIDRVPGTGGAVEVIDLNAASRGNCFYRLRVLP